MESIKGRPHMWPAMLYALLTLTGCPTREPTPPSPERDGGVVNDVDAGPDGCKRWCAHAAELHCAAARDTPFGGKCVDVCTSIQNGGIVSFNLDCRIAADTCAAAELCEKGR